jgi:hypothetical protein
MKKLTKQIKSNQKLYFDMLINPFITVKPKWMQEPQNNKKTFSKNGK